MIEVQEGLKSGDIVYVSFTAYKDSTNGKAKKKVDGVEYKVQELNKDYIRLLSIGGNYSIFFDVRTLEMFSGYIKKA